MSGYGSFAGPMICAVCGVETVYYHLWPGVDGDRPVCWEGGCESDGPNSKLLAALGIVRENGWLTSGPWGAEPPPEGLLAWFENAPPAFRESVDQEIRRLREELAANTRTKET